MQVLPTEFARPPELELAAIDLSACAPLPATYVEGTDHCGKDTVIDLLRATEGAGREPAPGKGAGFFLPCTDARLKGWGAEFPDPDLAPALLFAATVRDLALARKAAGQLPSYQASHNSIRGAAYSEAFGTDLKELFGETPGLIPDDYLPIALFTSLDAIGQRVLNNPNATEFDFMVFRKPEKVLKMLDIIVDRCQHLGGLVINTSNLQPAEVVEEIRGGRRSRAGAACASVAMEAAVLDKSVALLDALQHMKQYQQIAPVIERVLAEIYAI